MEGGTKVHQRLASNIFLQDMKTIDTTRGIALEDFVSLLRQTDAKGGASKM